MTLLPLFVACNMTSSDPPSRPSLDPYQWADADPHVWIEPSFGDCAPGSAVVAARILGVDLPTDDIEALMEMRRAMQVPETDVVQFESTAVGLRRMGLSVATFSPASVADIGLILDCDCVAVARYPISDLVGHAVAITAHDETRFRLDDVEQRDWRVVSAAKLQQTLLSKGNITMAVCRVEAAACANHVHGAH